MTTLTPRLIVVVLVGTLPACSPYAHRGEVETLSTATLELAELGERQRDWERTHRTQEIDARLHELYTYSRHANRSLPRFDLAPECRRIEETSPCHVLISDVEQSAGTASSSTDADPSFYASILPDARRQANERIRRPTHYSNNRYRATVAAAGDALTLAPADQFAVLQRYATGLLAITDADDLDGLQSAHEAVAANLAGVMQQVGPDGEAEERGALGTALAGAFGFVRRAQLNRRRLAVLRHVVGSSDESFQAVLGSAELYVETVRSEQIEARRAALRGTVSTANARASNSGLSEQNYLALYHTLETAAEHYSTLRATSSVEAFEAVRTAHRALAEALRSSDDQWVSVADLVHTFATSVEDLNEAIDAFDDSETSSDDAETNPS